MDVSPPLVSHHQPTVASHPRKRPFHYPAPPSEPLAAVYASSGDPGLYSTSAKRSSAARVIVALVGVLLVGPLARPASCSLDGWNGVHKLLEDLGPVDV